MSWDVIVVGARCAGSPLAMLLGRRGHRVLLLDRDTFPNEKEVCIHLYSPLAHQYLAAWGLLDSVIATGCPPIEAVTIHMDGSTARFPYVEVNGVREVYAPRRAVLDALLFDAAVRAGVTARQETQVSDLLFDDDRVTGVAGSGPGGAFIERGRIVVGADGIHSFVARRVGAEAYNVKPLLGLSCHAYWTDAEVSDAEFAFGPALGLPGFALGAIPSNDGLVGLFVGGGPESKDAFDHDFDDACLRAMREVAPGLAERFGGAHRVGGVSRRGYMPAHYRVAHGPGWALVGDAGFVQWPSSGHGVTDAFRDASLLADALDAVLREVASEQDALSAYARTRDEASRGVFEAVHGTGRPEYPSFEFAQAEWQEAAAGPLALSWEPIESA